MKEAPLNKTADRAILSVTVAVTATVLVCDEVVKLTVDGLAARLEITGPESSVLVMNKEIFLVLTLFAVSVTVNVSSSILLPILKSSTLYVFVNVYVLLVFPCKAAPGKLIVDRATLSTITAL